MASEAGFTVENTVIKAHSLVQNRVQIQLIEAKNLCVKYGGFNVLNDINFEISSGEIVTVVGPNGSGKTSFLKAIIGAVLPHKGTIRLKPSIKFGYVPQRLNIDPTLPISVERFMRHAGELKKCMSRCFNTSGCRWNND